MRTRSFAIAAMAVLLLNTIGFAMNDVRSAAAKKAQTRRLMRLLPASDGVAVFDSQRFFNDSLPKLLASNRPTLDEVITRLNTMQTRTGIDLRKFDRAAVGLKIKQ